MSCRLLGIETVKASCFSILVMLCAHRAVSADPAVINVPLSLQEALRLADERSFAVQHALQDAAAARGQITETRAMALPRVNLNAQYVRLDEVTSVSFGDSAFSMGQKDNYEAVAELQQVLYAGGGVRAALNLAREYEGAADAQVGHTRQLTAYAVHAAFNQVLLTREHRLVAEQALDLSRKNMVDVQSKLRQGVARNFDLLRAEAQVSQSEADRIAAENAESKARMALFRLLEIPLNSPRDVVGALRDAPGALPMSDPFSLAMEHRPDLVAARRMMAVQREAVRIAQSGSRPTIVAFGQGKYANPDRSNASDWEESWMVGVRAEMPIFDGLQTRGKVQQARARLRQAELRYEDTASQIRLEIAQAEADIETARRLVDALAQNVAESEASLQLARRAYEEGLQEQIDVITAQLALMNSKHRHASALYQQTMAQRALELAAGILVADADASNVDTGVHRAPITTGE